jgi:uncharacterized protein (DUF1499 family)
MTTRRNMRFAAALPAGALIVAILCAFAAIASGIGYRLGWWSLGLGFGILRWAAYLAIVATALAVAGVVVSRRDDRRQGLASAVVALLVGVATFGIPSVMLVKAKHLPGIHDITTDTTDPPKFVAVLPLRAGANARNSTDYGGPAIAEQQKQAYPAIVPLESKQSPGDAFARALDVARGMGWDIVAAVPAEGRIEATDATLLFGFKDDIVIRVAPTSQGSRVDVRSESRIGGSDVGKNASRIGQFLDRMAKSS